MAKRFSVVFQGKVYDDAWEDSFGHIWFGGNQFEYICRGVLDRPCDPYVLIKGERREGSTIYSTNTKVYAKLEILK